MPLRPPSPAVATSLRASPPTPRAETERSIDTQSISSDSTAYSEDTVWMALDVGGVRHVTTAETLLSVPGSWLAAKTREALAQEPPRSSLRIDRNGSFFAYLLDYLRNGRIAKALSPHIVLALATEARFFGLDDLAEEAKHVYPAREAKRIARHTPSFPLAYAHYAKQLALHGDSEDAEDRWEKLAPKLTVTHFATFQKLMMEAPQAIDQAYASLCAAKCLLNGELVEHKTEAVRLLQSAARLAPQDYLVHLMASRWCPGTQAFGRPFSPMELALKLAQRATQLDPGCFRAQQHLATLHTQLANHAGAAAAYRALTIMRPGYAQGYHDLAVALIAQGKIIEAGEAIQEALALNKNQPAYHQVFGNVLHQLGDNAGACAALRRSQVLGNPSPHVHEVLADVLISLGHFAEAEIEIQAALAHAPNEAMLHVLQAEIYNETNRPVEAEQVLGHALQLDPYNVETFRELSKTLRLQGRIAEAEFCGRQACTLELALRPAPAAQLQTAPSRRTI